MKISETMLLNEILEMDPDVIEVFLKHGLNCEGCPGAYSESLREAAEGHGVELGKLITDLNQFLISK